MTWNTTTVAEVMTPFPRAIDVAETVGDAVCAMEEVHATHVLVTRAGRLDGIVSDRDVLTWMPPPFRSDAARESQGKLARVCVDAIMTADPISTWATTTVDDAISLMLENNLSALPVIDDSGAPIGLLTLRALAQSLLELVRKR
ncbi:MAG: CBS domain-containing protein [Deltaproteobacteria bacterium]|nr:CBS domain-containing protein [Deltaproteobacteria bacterium]